MLSSHFCIAAVDSFRALCEETIAFNASLLTRAKTVKGVRQEVDGKLSFCVKGLRPSLLLTARWFTETSARVTGKCWRLLC